MYLAPYHGHGTVTLNGTTLIYTPDQDYVGTDGLTVMVEGLDGQPVSANVSIVVSNPPAPTIGTVLPMTVAYNSAGVDYDLSAHASGVWDSLAIAQQPQNGTLTVDGNIATYIPNAGYYGADSFTYTASGLGGVSAPATVGITVAAPSAPVIDTPQDPIVVAPQTGSTPPPTSVPLASLTNGEVYGYRITGAPQFGTAQIEDSSLTRLTASSAGGGSASPRSMSVFELVYTPAANFMGTDTVTIVAYGPGGDSVATTFTFQVAGKAPDIADQLSADSRTTFNPTINLVGGPFNAVRITRAPEMGTATVVDGTLVAFVPSRSDSGTTWLEYVVDLPFGSSAPGRIDLTINAVPVSQSLTATTVQGHPVTVRLSDTVGGPFTAATITSISPASAGKAQITGNNGVYDLTFTPEGVFAGEVEVGFNLTNAGGANPGIVTITVNERANPALDPEVRALATGQVTAARRFADTQIDNFQRRLESVRNGQNGSRQGVNLNLGSGQDEDRDPRTALRRKLGMSAGNDNGMPEDPRLRDLADLMAGMGASAQGVSDATLPAAPANAAEASAQHAIGFWTTGSVDWGKQDANGTRDNRFTTQGVTAGLDVKVSDRLIVGVGIGYGEDKSRTGENGSVTNS